MTAKETLEDPDAIGSKLKVKVYKRFPSEEDCIAYIERVRWHGKTACPYCKSGHVTPATSEHRHHCNVCNTSFHATVKTVFHHTHLPLQKWFLAISLILNAKNGVSKRQLGRFLEVNKNSAWLIGMRIRNAMLEEGELLRGIAGLGRRIPRQRPK
jgi:transposase-like protein